MLQKLNDVQEMCEEIADLMLLIFKVMNEAYTASEERRRTLEHIKKGDMRDYQIDRKEQEFKQTITNMEGLPHPRGPEGDDSRGGLPRPVVQILHRFL